jgi:hypothetical protein
MRRVTGLPNWTYTVQRVALLRSLFIDRKNPHYFLAAESAKLNEILGFDRKAAFREAQFPCL